MKISKTIIQGDTYTTRIKVKKADGTYFQPDEIDHIYYTSKKAGMSKEAVYDEDVEKYIIEWSSEETMQLKPNVYDFDITVVLFGTSVKTISYEGSLLVLAKHNEIPNS